MVCVHGNHGDFGALADAHGFSELDGVLIDTGVSSDQIDTADSGHILEPFLDHIFGKGGELLVAQAP
ncbi:MAG: hypothetical protein BWY83_01835 [bacterium ADurb.Bin478]|nr:MAG: hypothetical protein BWY83_01835 [bacterium ADurb.Bin478]